MKYDSVATLIGITLAACLFVAFQYVIVDAGRGGSPLPLTDQTVTPINLPDTKAGWWLSDIQVTPSLSSQGVQLADISASSYSFVEVFLPPLAANSSLALLADVTKPLQGQATIFAIRIALSDAELATCSFNTYSGAHVAWGVSGTRINVRDLGQYWRFECFVVGLARTVNMPVLRLLPSLGSLLGKTAPESTGSLHLIRLQLVRQAK